MKKSSHSKKNAKPVKRLSGGNPQIPKGDGDAPVQQYIEAMPGWKREIGMRLNELLEANMPDVKKAVRWNSPFFGTEGLGWQVSFHVLTRHVQVNFFAGAYLTPLPPGSGKDPKARWINIGEDDNLDGELMVSWIRQAAKLPGWESFSS